MNVNIKSPIRLIIGDIWKINIKNPAILSYCAHCDYKSPYKSSDIKHMNTTHIPQQTMLHCCCEFSGNDECGIRGKNKNTTSMTGDEVRTLINESFDVFQIFLKIKMQMGGVGNEDMIEESINASKCYMLEKIIE